MSFNKRYLDEEGIRVNYKEGFQNLYNYIIKPDALIITDEFSEKVVKIMMGDNPEKEIKELIN
jgi:hypothetical protein